MKYGSGDDYNASRYWHDRFSKYKMAIRGVGDEGLPEQDNKIMYAEAAKVVVDLCQEQNIDFKSASVLDIGCGNGFYAQLLYDLGVKNYTGLDITDSLFPNLKEKFLNFEFTKKDVSTDKINGRFNLILMIDVIQHIVKDSKLSFALNNVKNCLADHGVFILAPIKKVGKKHLFYVHFWSLEDIKLRFPDYTFTEPVPFRDSSMVSIINKH